MKWSDEAEAAIKKAPFFVRKKIRARVEKEAMEAGRTTITMEDVSATRNRFLTTMKDEVRGFQLDTCFGAGGCPNTIMDSQPLVEKIETILMEADLKHFLLNTVDGPLKFHHEFRVTLAECPNACSQPQIKDVGIIAAASPEITDNPCTLCGACEEICEELAITLDMDQKKPVISRTACVSCGKCINACPASVLKINKNGFRILLGGKLGRHPVLAHELPGIFNQEEVLAILKKCLKFYKERSKGGRRFSELLAEAPDFLTSVL